MSKKNIFNLSCTIVLIIFAYILRIVSRNMIGVFLPTLLTTIRNTIHVALITIWIVSIKRRIVNKQVRKLIIIVGILMAYWLTAKTIKYEFFPDNYQIAQRYLWYSYYIPMILIPLSGIFIIFFTGKTENYIIPKWSYCFYIPAIILIITVLTNDFHSLVFKFPNGIYYFNSDYEYGFLYWIIMGWYILLGLIFVILLLRQSRLPGSKKIQKVPLLILLFAIVFWLLYTFRIINADLTVIDCLFIFALLESSIQIGLVQSNSNYEELFKRTNVPILITDDNYNIHFKSINNNLVDYDAMRKTEEGPVKLQDSILSSENINAGKVIWIDDVTTLNKQRNELNDICEKLAEESELIQAETEIKERQAKADEKNNLYDKIANDVKKQLDLLLNLIDKIDNQNNNDIFAQIAIIGSYIKRRGNLLLVGSEKQQISSYELESALRESLESLKLLNVETALDIEVIDEIGLEYALNIYDLYENVIEILMDKINAIFVKVVYKNNGLNFSVNIGIKESISIEKLKNKLNNKQCEIDLEDEDLYIDLYLGGKDYER